GLLRSVGHRAVVYSPPVARACAFFGPVAAAAHGLRLARVFRTLVPALVLAARCSRADRRCRKRLSWGARLFAGSIHGCGRSVLGYGHLLCIEALQASLPHCIAARLPCPRAWNLLVSGQRREGCAQVTRRLARALAR